MSERLSDKAAIIVVAVLFLLYTVLRLYGGSIFEHHWSLTHWDFIAGWYPFVWAALTGALGYLLWNYSDALASLLKSRRNIILALSTVLFSFILFYFDSFLYGGGNIRVAQIAQSKHLILRWFEFGSIGLVSLFYSALSLFGLSGDSGGVLAWRIFAFGSSGAAIVAMARLSSLLSDNRKRQILLFLIGLFGAQSVLYFGFIGVETAVVPITIWFAFFAIRYARFRSTRDFIFVWLITATGIIIHVSLAFLLPSAVFLSVATIIRHHYAKALAAILATLTLAGLLHLVYRVGINSLEFSEHILLLNGKLPFSDYGLFSLRHIEDIVGLIFLVTPLTLAAKFFVFMRRDWGELSTENVVLWLMAFGGTFVVLISDPINSIVLDLPRFAAYLTPYSLLLALILSDKSKNPPSTRLLTVVVTVSIAIVYSYLPSYRYINAADKYVTDYTEKYPSYWRTTAVSLRDSYFYNNSFDKANDWDQALPIKSSDYLNLRGSNDLIAGGDFASAIEVLYRLVATNPYWTEPRSMLAATQLRLGRNELAKPQIDTCLLLRPYVLQHRLNLYNYYKNKKQMVKAIDVLNTARQLFPDNLKLVATVMAARYMNRELNVADSLALYLIATDSTMPDAFMIKGLIEDSRGNLKEAMDFYRHFVLMAPNDPDRPAAQKRLNDIALQLKKSP